MTRAGLGLDRAQTIHARTFRQAGGRRRVAPGIGEASRENREAKKHHNEYFWARKPTQALLCTKEAYSSDQIEKTRQFFDFRTPAPAAGSRSHQSFNFSTLASAAPLLSHARTQLRTHTRNATATATEIDFPVGNTPQPPMYIYVPMYVHMYYIYLYIYIY